MSAANASVRVILALTSDTGLLNLKGIPNLIRAFKALASVFPSQRIIVAVTSKDSNTAKELLEAEKAGFELVITETFEPAVLAQVLESHLGQAQAVLIHDASRPMTGKAQFEAVLAAFNDEIDAVRPAMAFSETLKILDANSIIKRTLDRSSVRRISTPELIRVSAIDFAESDGGWFLPLKKYARTLHLEGNPDGLRINTVEDCDLMELNRD